MVAIVILSAGIVAVYRSFFLCIDYLNNIATRWWANELIEEKMFDVTRRLQESQGRVLDSGIPSQTVTINRRPITFQYDVAVDPVASLEGLFRLNVTLSWNDGHKPMTINRSVYVLK